MSATMKLGARGMTAKEARAVIITRVGAKMNTGLSEKGATQFSFVKTFTVSATTWRRPRGPTRLGP